MSKLYEATCKIQETGRLPEIIGIRLRDALKAQAGKPVHILLEPPKKYVSDPQRAYYFAVIVEAIQELFREAGTIMAKEEMHHWLMEHVGKWFKNVVTPDGEVTQMRRSYMDLSTWETEQQHTLCRAWAAERGVQIPEPNEKPVIQTSDLIERARKAGSDKDFLEWVRSQPSAISGGWAVWNMQLGIGRCQACHYRTAENSGVGMKPEYSAIPMTADEHRLQHDIGQYAFKPREWWEETVVHYVEKWITNLKKESKHHG